MCFNKMIEYISKTDQEAFSIVKNLQDYENRLFESSISVLNQMSMMVE